MCFQKDSRCFAADVLQHFQLQQVTTCGCIIVQAELANLHCCQLWQLLTAMASAAPRPQQVLPPLQRQTSRALLPCPTLPPPLPPSAGQQRRYQHLAAITSVVTSDTNIATYLDQVKHNNTGTWHTCIFTCTCTHAYTYTYTYTYKFAFTFADTLAFTFTFSLLFTFAFTVRFAFTCKFTFTFAFTFACQFTFRFTLRFAFTFAFLFISKFMVMFVYLCLYLYLFLDLYLS